MSFIWSPVDVTSGGQRVKKEVETEHNEDNNSHDATLLMLFVLIEKLQMIDSKF